MKSLESFNFSVSNSNDTLLSLNGSVIELSALLIAKGWYDLSDRIRAADLVGQAKEQRLRAAIQSYLLFPNVHRGWELIDILREAQVALEAEYTYAKKQQALYEAGAIEESKSTNGFVTGWMHWLWHSVQRFIESSNVALAKKYAKIAMDYRDKLIHVSAWAENLQEKLLTEQSSVTDEKISTNPYAAYADDGDLNKHVFHSKQKHKDRRYLFSGAESIKINSTIFPAVIQLPLLNGQNGFKLDGETDSDESGFSVSAAGDINSDGYDDVIIGASGYPGGVPNFKGRSYVVFGGPGIGAMDYFLYLDSMALTALCWMAKIIGIIAEVPLRSRRY